MKKIIFILMLSLLFTSLALAVEKEPVHGATVIVPSAEPGGRAIGDDCTDPIVVSLPTALPYTDANQTNCGRGNTYDATCLGNYDGGEDIIYRIDVTADVTIDISMDPKGTTWTGISIDDECPDTGTCLDFDTGSSGTRSLTGVVLTVAGSPYYVMVDTWPTPDCIPDFDLIITETPACPDPTGQTVANIADNSADLGWTDNAGATYFDIELGPQGFSPTGTPTANDVTTNPYTYGSLSVDTDYDWYVRADCGGDNTDVSNWVGPSTFTTTGPPPPNDECAGAEAILECTDQLFNTSNATTSAVGTHSIGQDIWYVFTATGGGWIDVDLCGSSFDTKLAVWDDCDYTTELAYNDDDCGGETQSAVYDIPVTNGEDYFIQVGGYSSYAGIGDITIVFTPLPTCPDPYDLTATNVTPIQADLGWSQMGSPASWDLEFGTTGFINLRIPTHTAVTNPYTMTGLTGATGYTYYVRANCGVDGYSGWVGPYDFTTSGSCGIFEVVLTDDYGDGWNGGTMDVVVDGTPVLDDITIVSGGGPQSHFFPVDELAEITTTYIAGDWAYENEYHIFDQNGVEVGSDGVGGVEPVGISTPIIACPVDPIITVSPSPFDFGSTYTWCCIGPETFTISNTGAGTLTVTGTTLSGTDAGVYTLTDLNVYPIDLLNGEAITAEITFCPDAIATFFDVTFDVAFTGDPSPSPLAVDIDGEGIDAVVSCPEGADEIYSQVPDVSGWGASTSTNDPTAAIDYKVFDNFSGLTDDICDIHFWGIRGFYDGGWAQCTTDPMDFLIEFWTDDGTGQPDYLNPPIYSEIITFSGIVGMDIGGYNIIEWGGDLSSCVSLTDGWVSIAAQNDGLSCWFLWLSAKSDCAGDGSGYQWTGTEIQVTDYDFGFCLTTAAATLDAPVISSITHDGTDAIITWGAVTGAASYDVYGLANPNGTFVLLGNTTGTTYNHTTADPKYFYYVIAKDTLVRSNVNPQFQPPRFFSPDKSKMGLRK